jgi:cytochrome c
MLNPTRPVLAITCMAVVVGFAGCGGDDPPSPIAGAHPDRAAAVVDRYGCGSCHTIPGIRGADGTVGPSLADFANRGVLAGKLSMTTDNIVAWIMDPQALDPGVAMPDMGVSEEDARDVAAYLLTLQR